MRFLNDAAFKFEANAKKNFYLIAATLVIILAYFLTGWLALLLALPPGYASPIFPPAGIAVGAAFVGGRSSLIGIFLGALLLNLWISHSAAHLIFPIAYITAALIAAASTLQAGVGGWWLRRRLAYPCAFDKARDITTFLLLSPLMCLISASLSVASLFALGIFNLTNAAPNWLTWWLGDTLGVLIALPIVMAAVGQPRSLWRKRVLVIVAPMAAAIALFAYAFIQASRWEELESLNYLRTQVGWQSWMVLALGLIGIGLLGAFLMLSSGHAARVEMEVERHVAALRESEQRWQFALEGAGDGVWDIDLQTGSTFLSQRSMTMLGFDGEPERQINFAEWQVHIHPQDLERGRAIIVNYLAGGTGSYLFEFRTKTRAGQWQWIRARGMLMSRTPDGQPLRIMGTYTNIDLAKHQVFKETLHGAVMEMLTQGSTLAAVLKKITNTLHELNTDLVYAAFTAHASHFSMGAGDRFPADLHAREIPLSSHLRSAGRALQAGEIIHVPIPADAFWQHLSALAVDAGYTLCWSEFISSHTGRIEGALVAFKCSADSAALPDLDHLKHAANLIETAIQRKELDEQLQLADSVYKTCGEGIMVIDANHHIAAINPAFTAITGYAAADVIGRRPAMFRLDRDGDAFASIARQVDKVGSWSGEFWSHRKTGEIFPVSVTINTVWDESGNIFRRICVFSDITDKKIAETQIQHLASHDTLTGLPNRMLFRDRLQQALAIAQRERNLLALLYIDLDHFKPVNDNLGHMTGDLLLSAVADRMQACVRESDTVARVGGDEFVVLLPVIKSASDSVAIAEKIRKSVAECFELDGHVIHISTSIGIAIYPDDGNNERELSQRADRAMYLAKQNGRNTIKSYRD